MADQMPASFVPDEPTAAMPASFVPDSPDAQKTPKASASPTVLRRARQVLGDAVIGAVKGGGETAVNLGKLVHMVPGFSDGLDMLYGEEPGFSKRMFAAASDTVKATNTAQMVGKGAEQIGEAVLAGPTSEIGAGLSRIVGPTLAPIIGKTAANLVPRVAGEAGAGAGLAYVQGGDMRAGAAIGGAAPLVGAAVRAAAPGLKAAAEKQVVQALGPTKERFKAIANRLAPNILSRGLGGSRETLQAKAAETLETVGEQIDTALQQFGSKAVDTTPIVSSLETAKDAFRTTVSKPSPFGAPLQQIVEYEPRAIKQLAGLQDVVQQLGPNATVEQLTAVRRAWDTVVAQAGGYAQRAGGAIGVPLKDQSEAWAKREGASAIRKVLADDVPDLAKLNQEYSFWKNLDDVLTQTLQRTQPQGPGLASRVVEGGGQAVGAIAGSHGGPAGAVVVAGITGKAAAMLTKAFNSPRWQLASAKAKNSLADAILSGSSGRVQDAALRVLETEGAKGATLVEQ